eukprot:s297_g23.t1
MKVRTSVTLPGSLHDQFYWYGCPQFVIMHAKTGRPPATSFTGKFGTSDALVEADSSKRGQRNRPETHVLTDLSADLLEHVKEEFLENGGVLDGEQFVKAMMRNLDMGGYDRPGKRTLQTEETLGLDAAPV